jgi:crossover junction endodeoxyribonuclease RuvC
MNSEKRKIILGIDPGTRILGYGVVMVNGKSAEYLDMGVIDLKKESDHFKKLQRISEEVTSIINKYKPDELAIEAPFYGKNPQVMLKLGRAQGAAIASALLKNLPIYEYAPRSIKLTITGKGAASKEQVAMMVKTLLKIDINSKYLDATDALAIAMCHNICTSNNYQGTSTSKNSSNSKSTSWENFVKSNPQRVKK